MKKLITIILILSVMLPAAAVADLPDISGLTYDELVQLKDQINIAIWNSQEWQEVVVPSGVWSVGEDIPAGYWTITPIDAITSFWYGDKINESKTGPGYGWDYTTGLATTLNGRLAKDGSFLYPNEENQISIDMKEGMFVYFKCAMRFTPYSGKPDLGFN